MAEPGTSNQGSRLRRWITTVIVFLILGAIVNVAVAWGIAWVVVPALLMDGSDYDDPDAVLGFTASSLPCWFVEQNATIGARQYVVLPITNEARRSNLINDFNIETAPMSFPSWMPIHAQPMTDNELSQQGLNPVMYFGHAVGWPVVSMYSMSEYLWAGDDILGPPKVARGISVDLPNSTLPSALVRVLPVGILWRGFVPNSFLYAVLLGLSWFMVRALHRQFRIRRNLCPACGYPIGSSPVCTECGEVVGVQETEACVRSSHG